MSDLIKTGILVISLAAATAARAAWNVVATHPTNTWTQASDDTTNGYRWSDVNNWLDTSGIVENGMYALFNRTEGSDVALNAVTRASGIIVDENAGPVTIKANSNSYYLGLRRNGDNYPGIINYSSNPITIDAAVQFSYGQGATTVGWTPGVILKRALTFESGVTTLKFYDGVAGRSDAMDTTVIQALVANVATIYHLPNHRVVLEGEAASLSCGTYNLRAPLVVNGGTLAYSKMVLQNSPAIALTDATVRTTDFNNTFAAAITVNGSLTLDTTGGDLVAGEATYADDATSLTLTGGGSFAFKNDAAVHLFDSVTVTGTDAVTLKSWPLADGRKMTLMPISAFAATGGTYAPVKVAKSLGKTAEDFTEPFSGGIAAISVADDAEDDTLQVVTVAYPEYVAFTTTGTSDNDNYRMNVTTKWSDGVAAHDDADYLVSASANTWLRSSSASSGTTKFNGKSLTLKGTSSGREAIAMQKCTTAQFGRIVFLDYSGYRLGGNGAKSTGKDHFVEADFVVNGDNVTFYSESSRIFKHTVGSISGSGALKLAMASTTDAIFELYRDSGAFTGLLQVNGEKTTARFNSATGMGGNPATVLAKGLEIAYGTVQFTADDDLTIDQPNRGLYVTKQGTIENACDVTWTGPVAFDAAETVLTKKGAGALILTGDNSAAEGVIAVSGGSLELAGAYAAGRITVTGAATVPALVPTDAEEKSRKVAERDWLFVPDGTDENTPEQNLALVAARGWTVPANYGLKGWVVTLSQATVDGGGVMLRLGAKKVGFVIRLR